MDGETRAERVRDGLLEARLIARSAGETGLEEEPKRVLLGEDGRVMFCYRRAAYTVRPSGLTLTRGSTARYSNTATTRPAASSSTGDSP